MAENASLSAFVVAAVVEKASLVVEAGAWASELLDGQQEGLAVLAAEMLEPLVAWIASSGACTHFAAASCSTDVVALVGLLQKVLVAAAELPEELLAAAAELLGELLAAAVELLGELLAAVAGLGRALVEESFAR